MRRSACNELGNDKLYAAVDSPTQFLLWNYSANMWQLLYELRTLLLLYCTSRTRTLRLGRVPLGRRRSRSVAPPTDQTALCNTKQAQATGDQLANPILSTLHLEPLNTRVPAGDQAMQPLLTMLPSRLVQPSRCLLRCSQNPTTVTTSRIPFNLPRPFSQSRLRRFPDPYERLRNARPLVPNVVARKITSAGRSRNSKAVVVIAIVGAIAFYVYNSQVVPVTGRRRFNFLSDKLVEWAHSRAAESVIQSVEEQGGHFLSDWDPRTMLVKRVMKRLIPVSGLDLDWEIRVIADNSTYTT